ncbi:hypothetical protein, partial [Streptococcus agalactiae]|uniref:hypothetical protein n=1 Tax=Streptococcus agalactiae TaxID=1311 RepID=UPI001303115D
PDLRPIMQQPMSPDQSDSSAKSPEKSAADLNGKEDDKSSILSRQIPIIKVIGDLQDVSTLNIGKIPTYKSDGLSEPKLKMIHKDPYKHFDRELNVLTLKKELNDLKRNLDFAKEIKQKPRPDEESDRKEDDPKQARLEKNLAILKEANLD